MRKVDQPSSNPLAFLYYLLMAEHSNPSNLLPRNAFERVILANGGTLSEDVNGTRSYAIDCDDIEWEAVLAQRKEDRAAANAARDALAARSEGREYANYAHYCVANGWAVS